MLDFTGKTVIVTGAAGGIGEACARGFARAGASVVLVDIDGEKNQNAAARITADEAGGAVAITCDISDDDACEKLIQETAERFGSIDVLVNNAGIISKGTILDLDIKEYDRVQNVNLRACFLLTQLAAKKMITQETKGAIVNMSSVNSVLAIPNQAAYVTSKGGLHQLTRVSALALAEHGVRVNAIGPGSIRTELLDEVMVDDETRRSILSRTPLRRPGEPHEVASVALFLASDMASYITGQTIFPDGGRMALNYTVPVDD